ncbi:MAG: T9SS type A sorting domain-containing protein [Chitinophagaceae bacterium]|nr:T9SS type A sorting domain-containing protein [Chitinophagaceae bacterium]
MPQFQPSTGMLICVNAKISLTSVIRMRLENDTAVTKTYVANYSRKDTLSGPGISPSIFGSRSKNYGPYTLTASDGIPFNSGSTDNVTIGPDTVYNNVIYQGSTTNVASYLGGGSVNFAYSSNATASASGSDYYVLAVNSQNKLSFTLTYSYCNNVVLKLNLKSFQAILKDKDNVFISWTTLNENKNNNYEIELSENGSSFRTIGSAPAKPADGVAAKYDYQYHLDQPVGGKLYFRIKQVNGKVVAYSDVRIINMGTDAFPGVRIYPNPVVRNINLEFDRPLNGNFRIELSNQMGQVVYTTGMRLNNSTSLQVQLNNPPPPGIYYLRATETGSSKVYSGKLLFTK